jgi:hypothetical protein
MQHPVGILEGKTDLRRSARCGGRIRNTPMRRHGLTRPDRTRLSRRVVANGKDEIERRRAGTGELAPCLGTQSRCVVAEATQELDGFRMDPPLRLAAGAEGIEFSRTDLVQDGLGHDRTR